MCLKAGKIQKLINGTSKPKLGQPGMIFPEIEGSGNDITALFVVDTILHNQKNRCIYKLVLHQDF